MAGSSVIGALRVNLGLDSALFQAGAKKAKSVSDQLAKSLNKFADKAEAIGKNLSMVSAGMAAMGAAGLAFANNIANAGVEVDRFAKLANASPQQFQKWAAGAKRAGIEQDKLSDILKDVNDKVGDFFETGGGPMADFFENIAPKVGITAEAFRGLSGPDALQLYVSSLEKAGVNQQQMTFYMEALASDATGLLPLLAENGKAMNAYGDAAAKSGAVMSDKAVAASVAFKESLTTLQERFSGVVNSLAEHVLPIMTTFVDRITTNVIPIMLQLSQKVGEWITWFGELSPAVQNAAAAIAVALGTGGPVLLAISLVSKAFAALIAATGPIGLFIAAASLAYTAWQLWGDQVKAAIGGAADWIKTKFEELVAYFEALPARFAQFGRDIIDGLVNGLKEKWEAVKETVTGMADGVSGWFAEKLGIHSPSRVFQQFGGWIAKGLQNGLDSGASGVENSMQTMLQSVLSGTKGIKDALRDLATNWLSNKASGFLNAGLSALGGMIKLPGFSNGTNFAPAGLARVNERGGEIMNLPRGTQIIPNDISKRMADNASKGGGNTFHIDARGAQEGVAEQIVRAIQQATPSIVSQSVQATKAAQVRGHR